MGHSVFNEVSGWWNMLALLDTDTPGSWHVADTTGPGLRIDQLFITTDDTSTVEVFLAFQLGATVYGEAQHVLIPAGAGVTPGLLGIDLCDPAVGVLRDYVLPPGGQLYFHIPNAITVGKHLWLVGVGGWIG